MEDNEFLIAAGLRLGVSLVSPHLCEHRGNQVELLATHGLSCRKSQGRICRHSALNNILHQSLSAAGIPSHLEPKGTCPGVDGHPDGISMVPWKSGIPLPWDFTCRDTFAPSYLHLPSVDPGAFSIEAEFQKTLHYQPLMNNHIFVPVAVETGETFGPQAKALFREIGTRFKMITGDPLLTYYLQQLVSVCIQQGNAEVILGTINQRNCDLLLFD